MAPVSFEAGMDYTLREHLCTYIHTYIRTQTPPHRHLVSELHPALLPRTSSSPVVPMGGWSLSRARYGLGCGLPIVASLPLLPYPRSLPRPHRISPACLVGRALGGSRTLTVLQRGRQTSERTTRPAKSPPLARELFPLPTGESPRLPRQKAADS